MTSPTTERDHEVRTYADGMMRYVADLQREGIVPLTLRSFEELHECIDVYDLAATVGLEWGEDTKDMIRDAEDEVARRITVLAGGRPGPDDCSVCGAHFVYVGQDIAVHWRTPFTAVDVAQTCGEACSTAVEAQRNDERVLTPAAVRRARRIWLQQRKG